MGRLIDADALLEKFNLIYPHYFSDVEQIINEQPTVYDVDKVIEQLKAEMKSMKCRAENFQNWDYATGYISAISTLEGYVAMLEDEDCKAD